MTWPPEFPKMPPQLTALFMSLVMRIDANRPISGIGIDVADAVDGSGRSINRKRGVIGGAGGSGEADHPFRIITRKIGEGDDGVWKRGVVFDSELLKSQTYSDRAVITGLLTSDDPTEEDAGWASIAGAPDKVWLEITIGTWPAISAASIASDGAAGEWGGGEVEHDGGSGTPTVYAQTRARILLGIITPGEEDAAPTVKQFTRNYLILKINSMTGRDSSGNTPTPVRAVYPKPYG